MEPVTRRDAERDASDIIARLQAELDDILSLIDRPTSADRSATAQPASPACGDADRADAAPLAR